MADEAAAATGAAETTTATEAAPAATGSVLSTAAAADATETKAGESAASGAEATATKAEGEAKAEGSKDGEAGKDGKAEADKPIEYQDFTMPEGVEIDTEALTEAKALFAESKLPQEQAQKMVDFYAAKVRQFGEAQARNWAKLNEKWVSDFKADKEIGGDRLKETVSAAAKARDRFGTPELIDALNMTGAGNHPEVIRFFARVGKATGEDSFQVAGSGSSATRSAAEVLYPDQNKAGT